MLDLTPTNLWHEITLAKAHRDDHLKHLDRMISRHHAGNHPGALAAEASDPENFPHEYVSLMLPRLVLENPRVRIKSALAGATQETVLALRHALNRWARMVPLKGPLTLAGLDMLFAFGVMLTVYEPRPESDIAGASRPDDLPHWPNVYRIPQRWYFHDPLATDYAAPRYRGHARPIDLSDLKELARLHPQDYDAEVINAIGEQDGIDELRHIDGQQVRRGEVVIYEVWVPEAEPESKRKRKDGYHGGIYTLIGQGEGASFIRKPRAYWGPRWGPYSFLGAYPVIDSAYPLSPLAAVENQVQELNAHVHGANESARRYKRLVLCSTDNTQLIQSIKGNPHDFIVPVPGFTKDQVVQVEIGGVTEQAIAHIQIAKERVDRVAGLSEAQQGRPDPNVSATADSIASEASSNRVGFVRGNYLDGVVQVFKTAGWYMLHDERFTMSLGSEAIDDMIQSLPPERVAELGLQNPTVEQVNFQGGDGSSFDVDDIMDMVEIEPFSMNRHGEAENRALQLQGFTILSQLAPMVVQAPYLDWPRIFSGIGEAIGNPDLRNLVDVELANALAQLQIQAGFAPETTRGTLGKVGASKPAKPQGGGRQLPTPSGGLSRMGSLSGASQTPKAPARA